MKLGFHGKRPVQDIPETCAFRECACGVLVERFDPAETAYAPFTDDKAPVEALIDSLIFKTVLP